MTSSSSTIFSYLRFRAFFVVKNVSSNHEVVRFPVSLLVAAPRARFFAVFF